MIALLKFLRVAVIGFLIYLLYRFIVKKKGRIGGEKAEGKTPSGVVEEMKKDPVCGTFIPESQAVQLKRNRETFYFCSQACKQKFEKLNP